MHKFLVCLSRFLCKNIFLKHGIKQVTLQESHQDFFASSSYDMPRALNHPYNFTKIPTITKPLTKTTGKI